MYLMLRFSITKEFHEPGFDWTNNELWFPNKLVVDPLGKYKGDLTRIMAPTTYANAMKTVQENLGMPRGHLTHLGRNLGAKLLDRDEIPSEEIRRLGNWNPSIQESCYSTKLPMTAIRAIAGFSTGNGIYYNKRTTVDVPLELQKLTPIGEFVFDGLRTLENSDSTREKGTASRFLQFLRSINIAFLQDIAVMKLEHPERLEDANGRRHALFECVKALNSDMFDVSGRESVCSRIFFLSNRYYLFPFLVVRSYYEEYFRTGTDPA